MLGGAAGRADTGADDGRGSGRADPSGEAEPPDDGRDRAGRSGDGAGAEAGGGTAGGGAALTEGAAAGGDEEALGADEAGTGVSADADAVAGGGVIFGAGASPPIIVALSEMRSCGTIGRSSGLRPGLSPNSRCAFSSRIASLETVGRTGESSSAGGLIDGRTESGGTGGRDGGLAVGGGAGGAAGASPLSASDIASPLGMSMLVGSARSGIGGMGRVPRGGGGGAGRAAPSEAPALSRSAVELVEAPVPSSIVTMKSPT